MIEFVGAGEGSRLKSVVGKIAERKAELNFAPCLRKIISRDENVFCVAVLAVPPYVPSLDGAADTSHFDEFEPESPDPVSHLEKYSLAQEGKGFSGRDLPFVGFTFSRNLANHLPFSPRK